VVQPILTVTEKCLNPFLTVKLINDKLTGAGQIPVVVA
jgi:hypothetical protein